MSGSFRPGVRLNDRERQVAADRLMAAHHDGRIALDELDRRLAVVYAATFAGQLAPVLDDLPTADELRALGGGVVELDVGRGGLVRTGGWTVPRRMIVRQPPNGQELVALDLRTAQVAYPQIDIQLQLGVYGRVRMVLPPGASADLSGLRGAGGLRRSDVPVEQGAGLHVVVTGRVARRRDVVVRHPDGMPWWWRAPWGVFSPAAPRPR